MKTVTINGKAVGYELEIGEQIPTLGTSTEDLILFRYGRIPICDKCKKSVERDGIKVWKDNSKHTLEIRIKCHGEEWNDSISASDYYMDRKSIHSGIIFPTSGIKTMSEMAAGFGLSTGMCPIAKESKPYTIETKQTKYELTKEVKEFISKQENKRLITFDDNP